MATTAYFRVSVAQQFFQNHYLNVLRDLKAIPEVESIERVSGKSELLVKVNAPVRAVFVANKILVKEWVKSLQIAEVEPSNEPSLDSEERSEEKWERRLIL